MGFLRHRHHNRRRRRLSFAVVTALAFLFFASASDVCLGPASSRHYCDISGRFLTQRRLGGPGSSPPTCRSKCGLCSPCQAVHVPIRPGFSIPLEYYPEAWRCRCRDKLFMP